MALGSGAEDKQGNGIGVLDGVGRRDPARARRWGEHVAQQGSSGLSVRGYCAAEGLKESSFHYWKRELRLRQAESKGLGPCSGVFAEVALRMPGWDGGIEVVLAGERRLRVARDFDAETLRRVVSALEGLPC